MGKRLAGTCYFKVDGQQLELQGNLEFPMAKVTRETMASTGGPVGFKETIATPYIAGDFIVTSDFPTETLMESESMTITAECANGMVYTLSEAFMVGDIPYKPIDGTVALRFEGTAGELA